MENIKINYRATLVLTDRRLGTSVFTIERTAEDFNSFLEIVSSDYSDCDKLLITNIEVFSKCNYIVKYIKGERVL